ncbi:MAG: hypothetical protein NT006_05025 [Candidatus Aminicenantes bacterium]|jgi:hypothetical protein|nr:hypothetical protein [Candidatus Aminicenantes bacterium]
MAFWKRKPDPLDQRFFSTLHRNEDYLRLLRKPQVPPGSPLETMIHSSLKILKNATFDNLMAFNAIIPCLSGSNSTLRMAAESAFLGILTRELQTHNETEVLDRLKEIVKELESEQQAKDNPTFFEYVKPFRETLQTIGNS